MRSVRGIMLIIAVLALTVTVSAQESYVMSPHGYLVPVAEQASPAIGPETGGPDIYGSSDWSLTWFRAADFSERSSTREVAMDITNNCFYQTGSGDSFMFANIDIPNGSRIDWVEFYGNDTTTGDMTIWLCRTWIDAGTGENGSGDCNWSGGPTGTPAGFYEAVSIGGETVMKRQDIDTDGTIETVNWNLYLGGTSGTNKCAYGVRVLWKRQPSPAPASATFGDVPTGHWAFQFVEALAASGITAGCGGGNFCPDDPLNRSQMAVFLTKALGLHWDPFNP